MARPTKYNAKRVKRIVEAIELGVTYELAASYGGIAYSTFREWMLNKPSFSEAINAAEGAGAVARLAKINRAADDGNWQAAAWVMERRYPEQYGRTQVTHEHSGPGGSPIPVVLFDARAPLDAVTRGPETDR